MKVGDTSVQEMQIGSKIPNNGYPFPKTLIEYRQAIDNLKRQNTEGQYTERIALLVNELVQAEQWVWANTRSERAVLDQSHEMTAIMAFNSDKRFTITE